MSGWYAAPLWPYLVVVLVGFMPSELWRVLGALLSRGLNEQSELLVWVRAVATTLLAAVVAKLLLFPSGALADVPLAARTAAILIGLGLFFAMRRSVIAGVVGGEVSLIAYSSFWGSGAG